MNDTITFLRNAFPPACHGRIYLVGGSVRDTILGRDRQDIDLAACLTEAEFASCGFRLVAGRSTAPIWFRHDASFGIIEVTPLTEAGALYADLERRDFSVNALAMDLEGTLLDPLGGRNDLENRILRPCSARTFIDDPLRIFRAFRFESYGWSMSHESALLIREGDWSGSFVNIPVERFSREMLKALSSPEPERFFLRMLEFGVGDGYLPELFRMSGVSAGPLEHHPEGDLLTHSIQVLQRVTQRSNNPLARFCALFHDIGKLATPPDLYPRHHGHEETGYSLARDLCDRLRLPAAYRTALSWISRLHGKYALWEQLRDSTRVRLAGQAINAGLADILPLVSAADKAAETEEPTWGDAVRVARMTTLELGIVPALLTNMLIGQRTAYILQKRVETFRATSEQRPNPTSSAEKSTLLQ